MRKGLISIQITDTEIALLQAENAKEVLSSTSFKTRAVDGGAEEEVADTLKQMIGALPAKAGKTYLLIPRRFITLRQMWLPSQDREEIGSMIGIKLIKDIPFSVEDVTFQYILLDKDERGFHRVLVIIARKDLIQKYHRILQKAGIRNSEITISSLGILGWFRYRQKRRQNVSEGATALVDINGHYAEVSFCRGRKLFFSRSITLKKDHSVDGMARQIVLTLKAYQGGHLGPEVKEIFVVSDQKETEWLISLLQEETGIPAEDLSPLERIEGRTVKVGAAVSGILLSPMESPINLAFQQEDVARRREARKRELVRFSVLTLTVLALAVSGPLVGIHGKAAYFEFLNKETRVFRERLKGLDRKKRIVDFFDKRRLEYCFIPELMDELRRLTPEDVTFRVVSFDQKKHLVLQGYARTHAGINDFHAQLIRSERFSDVKMEFASERTIAHKPVVDFKIVSQLCAGGMKQL